jgi:hypothetical protein
MGRSNEKKTVSETDTAVRGPGAALIAKVATEVPYAVEATLVGECPILFHRWDCDAVESKGRAKKNSAEKKTDNLEAYVYRCTDGTLGVPGVVLKATLVNAAKFSQDPRSPRKSAADIFKAGVFVATEIASFGVTDWELVDRRRAMIQRQGITRFRPGMLAGWKLAFEIRVILPEYISQSFLHEVLGRAGRLVGLCDFRPEFGRFRVESCVLVSLA